MDVWVPLDLEHAKAVADLMDAEYQRSYRWLVGVYRDGNPEVSSRFDKNCGGCAAVPLNSDSQEAWEAENPRRNVGFTSVRGSPWFMRANGYGNQPDGDYTLGGWLSTNWGGGHFDDELGFRINDGWNYCYTTYLCSTNADLRPTGRPTPAPTPETPAPSSEPTVSAEPTGAPSPKPTAADPCDGPRRNQRYPGIRLRGVPRSLPRPGSIHE